jgi:putative ABC transport system substrate-binding protein
MRLRAIPGGAAFSAIAALLVGGFTPHAQAAPRRVSALLSQGTAPYQTALAAFRRAWDGPVSVHSLEFEADALEKLKAEHPEIVLAVGVRAARLVQGLGEVPVVYCMVLEPHANGLGAPLVVGGPLEVPAEVQLAELKRLLPSVQRVGLVYNPARSAAQLVEAQLAAEKLSLTLLAEPASSAAQFPDALKKLVPKAQALWLMADPTVVTQDTFRLMLESAMANRLPLLAFGDEFVRRGALLALSPDFEGAGAEAARLAREISQGKKPVEVTPAAAKWRLVVNRSTATALGIEFPPDSLKGAVEVQ